MARSKVDQVYRRLLLAKFFVKGWGKPENLHRIFSFRKKMADKKLCYSLVDPHTPVTITKKETKRNYILYEGHFKSPFEHHLPGLLPEPSQKAYFQMILPHRWAREDYRPVCIQLAGTGDHGFWKRRNLMAKPLVQDYGIGSILLENPFYGLRKPSEQRRSSLLNVSDLFVMGGCLVMESMVLMHWCLRQRLGPVGLTGISMGGHMASLACCSWPRPVPLVPCLSWTTASGVFTQGVLSGAINWQLLTDQYFSNQAFRDELFNLIHSPEGHFSIYHEVGQNFARTYPAADDVGKSSGQSESPGHVESCQSVNQYASGNSKLNGNNNSARDSEPGAQNRMECEASEVEFDSKEDSLQKSTEYEPSEVEFNSRECSMHKSMNYEAQDMKLINNECAVSREEEDIRKASSTQNEPIFLNQEKTVNISFNDNTEEKFQTSSVKMSNIEDRSKNSGFSHLDAQSNDLNAFDVDSTKKKLPADATLTPFDTRTISNSSLDHSNRDGEAGSQNSFFSASMYGDSVSNSTGANTGAVPSTNTSPSTCAPPSAGVAPSTSTGLGTGTGLSSSTGPSSTAVPTNASASAKSVMANTSGVFTPTKPTNEKFSSRGLLTNLNPLNLMGLNSASKASNASVPDAKKSLQLDEKSHPKERLDLLLGRYLKESTQKIISSSSSLFSWESDKSTLKDDPHLGFTPVGIRPASSQHQNMVAFKPYFTVKDPLTWEAVQFMRGIMDECTHVANFGHPTDPELIIIVQATKDAYEPDDTMTPLHAVWPGAELRTVDAGHIEAFVLHHQMFREAVRDAFLKTYDRYRHTENWTQGGKPCIPPDQL